MDRWMGGGIDGWMDGWRHGWIDGWVLISPGRSGPASNWVGASESRNQCFETQACRLGCSRQLPPQQGPGRTGCFTDPAGLRPEREAFVFA